MSEACLPDEHGGRASRAALRAGTTMWLALAAAPTFAAMALLTAVLGVGPAAMVCSAMPGFPIDGMVLMYALMGVFHLGPWLTLASRGRPERVAPP